jgi:hypothetical protein
MSRFILWSWVCLIVGVIGSILGVFLDPRRFFFSYLTAWAFYLTMIVGALLLLMIGHAVRVRWFAVLRRTTELVTSTLPLLSLLIVPVLLGLAYLYPWAGPLDALDEDTRRVIEHRGWWMSQWFFIVRSVIWLAVFSAFGVYLLRGSLRLDRGFSDAIQGRLRFVSSGGIVIVGFVLTWASFDWLMSLDGTWFSTIFGVYIFAGGFAAAIALITVLAVAFSSRGLLPEKSSLERQSAVGRMLFAFVIFWAYQGFSQLLIIWIGNIPDEVAFYVKRSGPGWGWVSFALITAHFLVPFLLLLSRDVKRRPVALAAIAWWVLASHYVDMYWLVIPNLSPAAVHVHWLDLITLVAVFGALGLFVGYRFRGVSLQTETDPYFHQSLRYQSWP